MEPAEAARTPISASPSSFWPLPATPARPTSSPGNTSKLHPLTARDPRSSVTARSRTTSTGWSPRSRPSRAGTAGDISPIMSCTSCCSVMAAREHVVTTRPRRITVIRELMRSASRILCVMKTTVSPCDVNHETVEKSASTSCGVSIVVGSSRMSTRTPRYRALRTSTFCWTPTESVRTRASRSRVMPYCAASCWTAARARFRRNHTAPSRPRITFSRTVNCGTSSKCWCTIPIPRRSASRGALTWTGSPSTAIVPASARYRPLRMFISVVLPAPFSPSSAWISPRCSARSTPSRATTSPKRLTMPRMPTMGITTGHPGNTTPRR